jgi:hypothetical protein
MNHVVTSVLMVWATIFIIPFIVYGVAAKLSDMEMPKQVSAQQFMLSVLVEKLGVATTFALVFLMADRVAGPNWIYYGLLWWYMFALAEIATAMRNQSTWKEAIAGIVSELIYFPVSAYIMVWIITP